MIGIHWYDFVVLFFMLAGLAVVAAIVFVLVAAGREKWRNADRSARR